MKILAYKKIQGIGISESNIKNWKNFGLIKIKNGYYVIKSNENIYDISSIRKIEISDQKWYERCILINHTWKTFTSSAISMIPVTEVFLIRMNLLKYLTFMKIQKRLWIQKEENIRYIINLLFLILGVYLAYKKII